MYGRGVGPTAIFTGGALVAVEISPLFLIVIALLVLALTVALVWRLRRINHSESAMTIQAC